MSKRFKKLKGIKIKLILSDIQEKKIYKYN